MAFPRPSTSGGGLRRQGGDGTTTFDKRMSKDDSFLSSRRTAIPSNNRVSRDDSYIRNRMAARPQFHAPVAGSTLTPAHSPPQPFMQEAWIPVRRMDTPESMTSGDIPIGMALGSPVHLSSDASRWQGQFPPAPLQMADTSPAPSPPSSVPNGSLQRKKTGRRKLFGFFGGGKKQAAEDARREELANYMKNGSAASTASESPKTPKPPTRSNTQSGSRTPKHKPLVTRSATMPYNMDGQSSAMATPDFMTPDPYMRQANENQARAMSPAAPFPRLDVLIPDTKMERYSVMFSDVLKDSSGKKEAPAPLPLLARRQATLERLKTMNGSNGGFALEPVQEVDSARPRRATSPQTQAPPFQPPAARAIAAAPAYSTASPRLSVFPMPPTGRPNITISTPTSQSRVARSNTSPGRFTSPVRLPSPTRAAFERPPKTNSSHGTPSLEVPPNPFGMNPVDLPRPSPKNREPIYPTDTSFHFGADKSGLMLDSPTSMDSREGEMIISQPSKPTLHEPQWKVVSSPAATNSSSVTTASPSSGRHARSPSGASNSTSTTKPSSELDASGIALQNAVEVSIARQISISRQQRNLLRPLTTRRPAEAKSPVPNGSGPMMGEGRSPLGVTVIKAPSPNRLGRDEAIKETKSSTPTLVHRRPSPVDPRNRKSSWGVLEESD